MVYLDVCSNMIFLMINAVKEDKVRKNMSLIVIVWLFVTPGDLCSQCRTKEGYAISLDIQRCVKDDTCGVVGVMIFIIIC